MVVGVIVQLVLAAGILRVPGIKDAFHGLGWFVNINPVYLFLQLIRDPIIYGTVPATELYVYASVLTVVLIGLAVGMVAWLQKRVIFHL